ncbi:relaxase/mobilization nuclease domain-containing protein [Methylobacterium sp. XJLW]|uniref:relaxase/mobilization nuclease domain-containing protein n=1 Tax=Methylobacterium sp. XJLW TaxID=739141 RepID=UPI000DAE49ED|nr:hypothetical protein [Methylobacterium sp. XJLW]
MISGATRGAGLGDALARHLLKGENHPTVSAPRGLGSPDVFGQLQELVAQCAGGRTTRPVYHVHCSPDPGIADNAAARARFWALMEGEFDLARQPYCGVVHDKDGRVHEHRVYALVRPSGSVIDLSHDYARREKCARIVEYEAGLAPVPSKHARSIAQALRKDGRHDVAGWLVAAGATRAERPIAKVTPGERRVEERTGVPLDDLRRAVFSAWQVSADGPGFVAALQARGLDLRHGREGPVVVDASGTAHLATRLVGAGSRRLTGERIRAAAVRARLNGLMLEGAGDGRRADRAAAGRDGNDSARHPGGAGAAGGGWGVGLRRPGGGDVRPDGGGGGSHGQGRGAALDRLRVSTGARRVVMRRHLAGFDVSLDRYQAAAERARAAAERLDDLADNGQTRGLALWGVTDIWGIPIR